MSAVASVESSRWTCHRALIRTAMPLSIGVGLQTVMSLTEVLVVGRLGVTELSAVAVASSVYGLLFLAAVGFASASVPVIANHVGAGRGDAARASSRGALLLVLVVTAAGASALLGATRSWSWWGLSPGAGALATQWTLRAAPGFPAICLFVWIRSVGTAVQRTGFVLRTMALAAGLNVVMMVVLALDGWPGLGWGVGGAGLASSVTRWGIVLASWIAARADPETRPFMRLPLPTRRDVSEAARIARIGIVVCARIVLVEGFGNTTLMILPLLVASQGIATHALGLRIASLSTTLALGLSSAGSSLVAKALGAGSAHAARRLSVAALQLALVLGGGAAVVLLGAAPAVIRVAASSGVTMGLGFLALLAVYQALLCVQAAATGALLGHGITVVPLVATVAGPWVVGLASSIVLSRWVLPGIDGFWAGLVMGHGVSSLWCAGALLTAARSPLPQALKVS